MKELATLILMQLKDKTDLSFVKSRRNLIIKSTVAVVKLAVVTVIFYLLFTMCVRLHVFSFASVLPDSVINILFTAVAILAIVSCTVGLTDALYFSHDNRVLLTMPVNASLIFISKLLLFYIFELKRNLFFTLPMFVAYAIVNSAVWYFYLWMFVGFAVISAIPVMVGAILSIPTLFISAFIRRHKWIQYIAITAIAALIVWVLVAVISAIPQNINLLGQWGTISVRIQEFLTSFSAATTPIYWMCLLVIGGTLRISASPIGVDTLTYLGIALLFVTIMFMLAYLIAKPLFFRMVSRQFEYERLDTPPRRNVKHSARLAPYFESLKMAFRDSKRVVVVITELTLPFIAVLLLNKLYAAMNMSYTGMVLSQTFNMLVLFVITLSLNTPFASVYSREAGARDLLKTRPVNIQRMLFSRIALRAATTVLSAIAAIITYGTVGGVEASTLAPLFFTTVFLGLAHLLWCADIDIMKSQAAQYRMVGMDFNNPNERAATTISMVLAALFAFAFYTFTDMGVMSALVKITLLATVLLLVRAYLYAIRIKHYFTEK